VPGKALFRPPAPTSGDPKGGRGPKDLRAFPSRTREKKKKLEFLQGGKGGGGGGGRARRGGGGGAGEWEPHFFRGPGFHWGLRDWTPHPLGRCVGRAAAGGQQKKAKFSVFFKKTRLWGGGRQGGSHRGGVFPQGVSVAQLDPINRGGGGFRKSGPVEPHVGPKKGGAAAARKKGSSLEKTGHGVKTKKPFVFGGRGPVPPGPK